MAHISPTELLQKLIQIPSVNPDDTPGTDLVGEKLIAEYLADFLTKLGADVLLEYVLPERPNLIARFAPRDGRKRILFAPHSDTVGVGAMMIDPFTGKIHDGKIWGRGASDTKGPMVAMLCAMAHHVEKLKHAEIAVDFVAFMGEESSQHGSKHFAEKYADEYDFAIVGEPTDLQIVRATKGSLWATLSTSGKAAHSSMPEQGDNAVMKMAAALLLLEKSLQPKLARYHHDLLGICTMNVGLLRGGTRPNIVPDYAEAKIDIRTTPAIYQAGGALALLEKEIHSLSLPLSFVDAHENPPMDTDATHPIIQLLEKCGAGLTTAPWFSDAAHLSAKGIPSICLGPGSIKQAHTADEFISIHDLENGVKFFSDFLAKI